MPRAPMVATNRTTGEIVEPGTTVTNFRGETGTFAFISRGAVPGKSGKVIVDGREYYDGVWDLKITAMLPCGCVVDEHNDCVHPTFGVVSV